MRILHVGNMASVPSRLATAQKMIGHEAIVYDPYEGPFSHGSDIAANYRRPLVILREIPRARRLVKWADVIHYHDVAPRTLRGHGKRHVVVWHHHGSRLRAGEGPLVHAEIEYVSTPDLLHHGSTYLPCPIAPETIPRPPRRARMRILHAPSDPDKKGTSRIRAAFLHDERFDYREVRGPWRIIRDELFKCDVLVDQWGGIGAHGVISLEALALGKIVMTDANDDHYPDNHPFLNGELEDAKEKLLRIDPDEQARVAHDYLERHHDPVTIARRVTCDYEEVESWG